VGQQTEADRTSAAWVALLVKVLVPTGFVGRKTEADRTSAALVDGAAAVGIG
jgi:hypothetical protein